jgi:hypothetical protein
LSRVKKSKEKKLAGKYVVYIGNMWVVTVTKKAG